MPTIAMINGHCFAGGLITAMMHDYRFMNPHKGFLCMNELDFGAPLKPPMSSIFRQKLPRADVYRTMVLEAKRFNALEALEGGLVDGLGQWDVVEKFVVEMKLVGKADSGVYGQLKEEMWRETIGYLEEGGKVEEGLMRERAERGQARLKESRRRIEDWAKSGRAKL